MKKIFLLFLILCFLPIFFYFYYMWYSFGYTNIAKTNAEWGAFGSYLGGVLTPLFTLLSIFFIYFSIVNNNKNHKIEMIYLHEQQTLLNTSSLAESINEKLNEKISFNNENFKNKKIAIYNEECKNFYSMWSKKNNIKVRYKTINLSELDNKLIEILKDYSFYRNNNLQFNPKYMNVLRVISMDYHNTFFITLKYISEIKDESLRNNALMLLSAKVNDLAIINLYHLLADYTKYNIDSNATLNELSSIEYLIVMSLELSNQTNSFEFLCIPLLKMYLKQSFFDLIESKVNLKFFKIKNKEKFRITMLEEDEFYDVSDFLDKNKKSKLLYAVRFIFTCARISNNGMEFPFNIESNYLNGGNRFSIIVKRNIEIELEKIIETKVKEYRFYFRLCESDFNLENILIIGDK